MEITLTPAFGRDYRNMAEVIDAFNRNDDFILNVHPGHEWYQWDGKPTNREQVSSCSVVIFRYAKLKREFRFDMPKGAQTHE